MIKLRRIGLTSSILFFALFVVLCGFTVSACNSLGTVSLGKTELILVVGKTENLGEVLRPAKAASKGVTWVSDQPDIASVDENGLVSANDIGTATITVTTAGGQTAECTVTVRLISMVLVNGGTFTMGSEDTEPGSFVDEHPTHDVTLSNFYMSEYQITQKQWELVIGSNPSEFSGDGLPVEMISWYDALVFCNKLSIMDGLDPAYRIAGSTDPAAWGAVPPHPDGDSRWNAVQIVDGANGYRLPTEAQWEYACRAGTGTPFNVGRAITTGHANYDGRFPYNDTPNPEGTFLEKTTPVGSFAPNAWGLYDMHGNLWEWCWNWYGLYPEAAQVDPQGSPSGTFRVVRSGSWTNRGQNVRSAARGSSLPSFQSPNVGLRVVHP